MTLVIREVNMGRQTGKTTRAITRAMSYFAEGKKVLLVHGKTANQAFVIAKRVREAMSAIGVTTLFGFDITHLEDYEKQVVGRDYDVIVFDCD